MICVTVNDKAIEMREALQQSHFDNEDFLNNTIENELIRQYAAQHTIANTDEQLQVAADEWRYQLGLEAVDKLNVWLKSNHQTALSLQNALDGMLLRNKVRNAIPPSEIEAYFADHRSAFDRVELYSIRVETLEQAQELSAQITEEGANFHVVAMEHSTDEETRPRGGYVGTLARSDVTAAIEAAVFQAQAGDIVGPLQTDNGYNLFKVSAVHKADLEAERDGIQLQVFADLVARLKAEATIHYPVLEEV